MNREIASYVVRVGGNDRAMLGLLLALGMVLRWPTLGASFTGDEAFSLLRDSNQLLLDTDDRYRPLFFSLLFLWKQLGFTGEVGLRLVPFIFGALQVPLAYWVGARTGGRSLAILLGFLVAANPMLVEFSQELRMYSMLPFFTLLQTALLLEWAHRSEQGRPTRWLWLASIPVAIAGVYTHLHYWVHLAGLSLTALRLRRHIEPWRVPIVVGAVLLAYVPNVPHVLEFADTDAKNADLQADDAKGALPKLLVAFSVGFNYFRVPEQDAARTVKAGLLQSNLDLVALTAVPLLLLGIAAAVPLGWKFIHPKYMVGASPFFLLLCAGAVLELARNVARWALAATGLTVWGVSFAHYWNPREYGRREDWQAARDVCRKEQAQGSTLLLIGTFYEQSYPLFQYYAPDLRPRIVPTYLLRTEEAVEQRMKRELGSTSRFCYLRWDTLQNMEDPQDRMLTAARRLGREESLVRLNPRLMLYCWNSVT